MAFAASQLVKKVFLTSWWTGEQAIHNSQWSVRCARRARLRPSLAYWAYFALLRSSIRNSRLATLPLASLLCSLDFRFACFAHCARRSSVPLGARFVRPPPLPPSTIRNSRLAALPLAKLLCSLSLLRPVSRTARGLRAPHQFPLKSYGFPGAETAKKRFLLWKMGFSGAKIAPSPPYTPPGTIKARKGFGSTIRHGRSASSHHATFSGPVFRCCARRSFSSPFQKTPAHGFTNATICGIL